MRSRCTYGDRLDTPGAPAGLEGATEYVDVVTVRRDSAAPAGATTVLRLLGLVPAHWSCTPEIGHDRIRLRVGLVGSTDRGAVYRVLSRVLADPALRGWSEED
ncbi:hypothetical protein ABCR94_34820 [Streptomyces sp. 21So2-11]|uniref:hypothetical protein n=1 Tax=Streptomyces sp. 21So2-11 TaxID=3144408 RepID=UPI00321B4CE8